MAQKAKFGAADRMKFALSRECFRAMPGSIVSAAPISVRPEMPRRIQKNFLDAGGLANLNTLQPSAECARVR